MRAAALTLTLAGLALGGAAVWAGRPDLARLVWSAVALGVSARLALTIGRDLLAGRVGVDAIALVAMLGAVALGEALAGAVVALMATGGAALETFAVERAARDLRALVDRAPRRALRRVGAGVEDIAVEAVEPGDLLLVRGGAVLPVDGVIAAERAVLDEQAMTGEALPATRRAGDAVRSGTVNVGEAFDLRATARVGDSAYAAVVRMATAAEAAKAPMVRLADRYAIGLLPATLLVAGAGWAWSGDPTRALAVLVAATPCPLIIAAPVAFVGGVSRAARRGVLVKGGAALEALARARVALFDKTGTLTIGAARPTALEAAPGEDAQAALRLAGALEQGSSHVLAAAIAAEARARCGALPTPSAITEARGVGLEGMVDGRRVRVGASVYAHAGAAPEPWAEAAAAQADAEGALAVFVAVDDRVVAALRLEDAPRPEAARAVAALRGLGFTRIEMLTGDRRAPADRIAAGLGLDAATAELDPAAKLARVAAARGLGPVMMVGDGLNDAPALAAADVGVALGARGASASSQAADVVLLVDRLDLLPEAVAIARRARAIAEQSIVVGLALSAVVMAGAAAGWVTPVAGALAQEAIDVAVILNALRALGGDAQPPRPSEASSARSST